MRPNAWFFTPQPQPPPIPHDPVLTACACAILFFGRIDTLVPFSTTFITPVNIPMLQENGILPVSIGVNSITFSPNTRFFRILNFREIILLAQELGFTEVIIHFTGTPFTTLNSLGL